MFALELYGLRGTNVVTIRPPRASYNIRPETNTWECLAIYVDRQIKSSHGMEKLTEVFVERGTPAYLRSCSGPEFSAEDMYDGRYYSASGGSIVRVRR